MYLQTPNSFRTLRLLSLLGRDIPRPVYHEDSIGKATTTIVTLLMSMKAIENFMKAYGFSSQNTLLRIYLTLCIISGDLKHGQRPST